LVRGVVSKDLEERRTVRIYSTGGKSGSSSTEGNRDYCRGVGSETTEASGAGAKNDKKRASAGQTSYFLYMGRNGISVQPRGQSEGAGSFKVGSIREEKSSGYTRGGRHSEVSPEVGRKSSTRLC